MTEHYAFREVSRGKDLQNLALSVAISEVLAPTLGVTEQVLAVHSLVIQDGNPVILSIDKNSEQDADYIYFKIENEPYYFVVVVWKEDEKLIAGHAYIEAGVRVYLKIRSTTLYPDVITEKAKLKPTRKQLLGDAIHPQSPVKLKENRWYFEPQKNVPGSLENKLKFLLDQLEPAQPMIASLQNECEIYIVICYEGYRSQMGGWYIDKTTIRRIAALGAEIDLDLYACGEYDLPCD